MVSFLAAVGLSKNDGGKNIKFNDISIFLYIDTFTLINDPYFVGIPSQPYILGSETDGTRNFDTILNTDTVAGSKSIPRLILILGIDLDRDRYWYWYQENVPGLILIPRLYLIRDPFMSNKIWSNGLNRDWYWYRDSNMSRIDTDTDTKSLGIGPFDTIPIFPSVSATDTSDLITHTLQRSDLWSAINHDSWFSKGHWLHVSFKRSVRMTLGASGQSRIGANSSHFTEYTLGFSIRPKKHRLRKLCLIENGKQIAGRRFGCATKKLCHRLEANIWGPWMLQVLKMWKKNR